MLTIVRQRAGLACVLFILCIVITVDLGINRSRVHEGFSSKEINAACNTEADEWASNTDLGTTETSIIDTYKSTYVKQCEEVGARKHYAELLGQTKAMNALYNNSYAKQLLQMKKDEAVQQVVGNLLTLGAEAGRVQTSDKPAARAVRNYAAYLEYIDLVEKNLTGPSAGSVGLPSQPASDTSEATPETSDSKSSYNFGF